MANEATAAVGEAPEVVDIGAAGSTPDAPEVSEAGPLVVPEGGAFQLPGWDEPMSTDDFAKQFVRESDYTKGHQANVTAFEDRQREWEAKRANVEDKLVTYARDLERRAGAPGQAPGTAAGPAPQTVATPRLLAGVAKTIEAAGGTLDSDSITLIEDAIGGALATRDAQIATLNTKIQEMTGQVTNLHQSYQGLREHNQTASREQVVAEQKKAHPEISPLTIDMAVRSYNYENFEQEFPGVVASLVTDHREHRVTFEEAQKEPSIAGSGIPALTMASPTPSTPIPDAVDDMDAGEIAELVMKEFPEAFERVS